MQIKGIGHMSKKTIVVALVSAVIGGGIAYGGYLVGNQHGSKSESTLESKIGILSRSRRVQSLTENMQNIRDKNAYLKLVDGEDSTQTYLYNSHGEAVLQSDKDQCFTVFTNQGESYRFTDKVEKGADIDILQLAENSLKLVGNRAEITEPTSESEDYVKGFETTCVTIHGFDNIRGLYEPVGEEFADNMIANMKKSVPANVENVDIRFRFIRGDNGVFSAGCELIMDNKKFMLWYFDGYLSLYDWQLSDIWYEDSINDNNGQEVLQGLIDELDEMFKEYSEDKNLNISTEEKDNKVEDSTQTSND